MRGSAPETGRGAMVELEIPRMWSKLRRISALPGAEGDTGVTPSS
jgi:hypothetical protein